VRYFWTKPVWSWKFGEERWKPTKASGEGRGVVRRPGGESGWTVEGLIAVSGGVELLERDERGRGVEGVGGAEGIGEEREWRVEGLEVALIVPSRVSASQYTCSLI
jgi:hypothetical protein